MNSFKYVYCSMITESPMSQTKYKLLINPQQSHWKTQIFYFVVIFLIIGIICTWISILISKIFYVQTLEELNQEKKTLAGTWLHQVQMYTISMKENHTTNKNINIDREWQSNNSTEKIIVCYYIVPKTFNTAWNLSPSQIDPHICTHIIIGFASIVNCTVDMGVNTRIYEEVVNLKKNNSKLKVMISIGGGNEFNFGFPEMVKNHANRKRFIRSVLNVTKRFKFDGLDLDWEFPAWFEPNEKEKIHFVQLLYEIRKEFDHRSEKLILSVAAAAPQTIIDQSYDVPEIAKHVDFINLMSYDYHYYVWYFPVTDLNAPLFPHIMESGYLDTLNVNFSAHYWVKKMMPRYKIVIGIPTYGHSYKLDNPLNHKLQAPASGFGKLGSNGFVSYSVICQFLKHGASNVFVNKSKVPYAYRDEEWISYDNKESIYYKAKWVLANGFKGAMIFSLNTDDWKNECNTNESFPLTRTITKFFKKGKY
ncbi:chitinase-3-like protein 2 [Vespula pensylvanica]|nr:chitinase-3-like protein 2 [Vespula pensylvanica]